MAKPTDMRCIGAELYFLPVETRMPLKFGPETLTSVTCARVRVAVRGMDGREAEGWGETPLSVQWVWPSSAAYSARHVALKAFCEKLVAAYSNFDRTGHALEIGHAFQQEILPKLAREFDEHENEAGQSLPHLAALVCCSAFDIALHDAYGKLVDRPIYETYNAEFLNADLAAYLEPADREVSFAGKFPEDFFVQPAPQRLPAWHLVGGLDPLSNEELRGDEPNDGYPVLLDDWIERDGLNCLKIKLRGNDAAWDYDRIVAIGEIAQRHDAEWLTADFNCTVTDPQYVNDILDRLKAEQPRTFAMISYVEQPFPYDLDKYPIDVHSVSARKPLLMDESAHEWRVVRDGYKLGWSGVALKTCKTQTGALLSLCWAKAHGMTLMVQDLTNPMLAQIPHVQLAAYAGTIMGVETNAMQFYPEASAAEALVHPGLYQRRKGCVDLSTIRGAGFGYRRDEIQRSLPAPVARAGPIVAK